MLSFSLFQYFSILTYSSSYASQPRNQIDSTERIIDYSILQESMPTSQIDPSKDVGIFLVMPDEMAARGYNFNAEWIVGVNLIISEFE